MEESVAMAEDEEVIQSTCLANGPATEVSSINN